MSLASKRISSIGVSVAVLATSWWFTAGTLGTGSLFGRYSKRAFVANVALTYILGCIVYLIWPATWQRKRFFRIVGATFGFCIAMVILELPVLVGLVDYRKIIRRPFYKPWADPDKILEEEIIFRRHPHEHITGSAKGDLVNWLGFHTTHQFDVDVKYDRYGFRNPKDLEQAELIVIGDSFVEAPHVPIELLSSTRIAKQLNTTVLNLGLSGYGPQQELAVLRRFGYDRKPRAVIWIWFEGNDAPPDYNRYESFTKDWSAFVNEHHGLVAKSFSLNFMRWLGRTTTPNNAHEFNANQHSGLLKTTKSNDFQRMYFGYDQGPFTKDESQIVQKAFDVVGIAAAECRNKGIEFLLVYSPTKFRVYGSICQWEESSLCKTWINHNMPNSMETWANNQGISFLNLTPHLQNAAQHGELVYELEDTHWTPAGQGLIAQQIADFIQQAGWLSDRS